MHLYELQRCLYKGTIVYIFHIVYIFVYVVCTVHGTQ